MSTPTSAYRPVKCAHCGEAIEPVAKAWRGGASAWRHVGRGVADACELFAEPQVRAVTCPTCGTDRCHLAWAAMESWDTDSWACVNGHTWAETPVGNAPRSES